MINIGKRRTKIGDGVQVMDDTIYRQAAIEALKKISFSHWFECGEYLSEDTREIEIINSNKAFEAIEALPSAQPERKKGRWKLHREHERIVYDIPPEGPKPPYHIRVTPTYKCSECGYISFDYAPNFCEKCGADMRGEQG